MKRLTIILAFALVAALAAPLAAAPRGHGSGRHGGHRGSGRHVIVRPGFWGWGFGWYDPLWYGYGYGPYGYGPYYRGYYGRYGYGMPRNWAVVDTDVSPESARVYLDGQYIGTADDFDGYPDYLYLKRGRYRLEFRLEGFQARTIEVNARPGVKIDVDDKLARVPGAPRYGSYDTPEPRGGVRRFWGKRNDVSVEITDDDDVVAGEERQDRYEADEDSAMERDRSDVEEEEDSREAWRSDRSDRPSSAEAAETRLVLDVRPSDASIYLDDRFIGAASELGSGAGVAVAPGRHTLVVSRPGYRERRIEVDVTRGEAQNVEITLER